MNRNNRNKKGGSGNFRFGGNRFGGRSSGGFRKNNFDRGPREMHKAVCADCKQDCEVPFKPAEGKPVYCKECYSKHRKS